MRRLVPFFILSLALATLPAEAQSFFSKKKSAPKVAVVPALTQPLLPSSFAGWSAPAPSFLASSTALDSSLGSDAPIFHEYSVQSVERRTYSHADKTVTVMLYRVRDPSTAYGVYTFLRDDSLTPPVYHTDLGNYTFGKDDALVPFEMGSFGCASKDRALVVAGNLVLDVTSSGGRPADADLKLLTDSLQKVADHTPFPSIGAHLPDQGHIRRSEHYVVGPAALSRFVPLGTDDWIGFVSGGAEAITARYQLGGNNMTLLIASYPTQQVAADKFDGMLRQFTFDPPGGVTPGQTALFGKRSSSLIAVVIGAPSRAAANTLLDQISYESQVTWNEPGQSFSDPSISSIVVGAFLGTGIIMLLALMFGVGFGGLRVLLKIFLPNKVFDREEQIEILQLGIYSKPIKAKDFYQKAP